MDEILKIFGIDPSTTTTAPHQVGAGRDDWADVEDVPERTADETYALEQRYNRAVAHNQRTGRNYRRY